MTGPGPSPTARRERRKAIDDVSLRRGVNVVVTVLAGLCVVAVLVPLASILYEAIVRGGLVIFTPGFFTDLQPLPCSQLSCSNSGIGPALQGTVILVGLASVVSSTIGISAAIFASEYRTGLLGRGISFTADVLTGVPSIIMGTFIYCYFVLYDPSVAFSTVSGTLALSALMLPIVVRTTEEALRTVPNTIREAALALGAPRWRITISVVLTTAFPGVLTGILLGAMRAAGDAAPLIVTAFGSRLYFQGLDRPISALPLLIFNFAESPYTNWISVAWGATLVLIVLVLTANVLSRVSIDRMVRRMSGK